jgi:competence protein ComEA
MRRVGLIALIFFLIFPSFAHAALININTADATLLDTLPGIGPTKAAAIIDYRTTHGPFATVADIQNVSGIGPSTYADIAPLITVGSSSSSSSSTASSTTSTASSSPPVESSGGTPEYLVIPQLHIRGVEDRIVSVGADTAFSARVYDDKSTRRTDVSVVWNFGDGTRRPGTSVFHAYYASGEYVVIVRATTPDGAEGETEVVVRAQDASVRISKVSPQGITLLNSDTRPLDLSGWRLSAGEREYRLPEDTFILGGKTILLPVQVLGFPLSDSATLFFPNGEIANTYPSIAVQKMPVEKEAVSFVSPAPKVMQNIETPQEEVSVELPATVASTAAATGEENFTEKSPFSSPWFMGFVGVVLLAGAAFIFI